MTTANEFWDRIYRTEFDLMTEPERLYFAASWFSAELASGGLSQFFDNEGVDPQRVEEGLAAIGAADALTFLREARVKGRDSWNELTNQLWVQSVENDLHDKMEAFAISQGLYEAPHD